MLSRPYTKDFVLHNQPISFVQLVLRCEKVNRIRGSITSADSSSVRNQTSRRSGAVVVPACDSRRGTSTAVQCPRGRDRPSPRRTAVLASQVMCGVRTRSLESLLSSPGSPTYRWRPASSRPVTRSRTGILPVPLLKKAGLDSSAKLSELQGHCRRPNCRCRPRCKANGKQQRAE